MKKILGVLIAIVIVLISLPFMVAWTFISSFWVVFGSWIISFFLIALFGGTLDECLRYSGGLAFFVGVVKALITKK